MSFTGQETSQYGGRPVELLRFYRGVDEWLYTGADHDITLDGKTYAAIPMGGRSSAPVKPAEKSNGLTIPFPIANALAMKFRIYFPATTIYLDILQFHEGDGEPRTVWTGRLRGVSFKGTDATLTCQSLSDMLQREGPRMTFQVGCQHQLYSQGAGNCQANPASYVRAGTVTAIGANTISSAALGLKTDGSPAPNGWYTAGFVARNNEAFAFITDHSGTTATIDIPFEGLEIGETLDFYAGCDHTFAVCKGKFGNEPNYGGCPYMPIRDPHKDGI
jgi:uncharacterized phage protein (TIGR02218 family)